MSYNISLSQNFMLSWLSRQWLWSPPVKHRLQLWIMWFFVASSNAFPKAELKAESSSQENNGIYEFIANTRNAKNWLISFFYTKTYLLIIVFPKFLKYLYTSYIICNFWEIDIQFCVLTCMLSDLLPITSYMRKCILLGNFT